MNKSIQLQSVGRVPAVEAINIEIGDYLMWNFGSKSKVIAFGKETKSFITVVELYEDGKQYERRLKKDRLVALIKKQ